MKTHGYQCQRDSSMPRGTIGYFCRPASLLLLLTSSAVISAAPAPTTTKTASVPTSPVTSGGWCAGYDVTQSKTRLTEIQESMNRPRMMLDSSTVEDKLKTLKKLSDVTHQASQDALDIILGGLPGAGHEIFNRLGEAILFHLSTEADIPSSEPLTDRDEVPSLSLMKPNLPNEIEAVIITHADRLAKMTVRLDYMRHNVPALDLRHALDILHGDVMEVMCALNSLYLMVTDSTTSFPDHLSYDALSADEKNFISENTISGEGLRYGEVARTRSVIHAVKVDAMTLKGRVQQSQSMRGVPFP